MPRAKQSRLFQEPLRTAPCVPAIRKVVGEWRQAGYPGVTDTTSTLLNYWFLTDHRQPNGRPFQYHPAQREALESLIYLYEVAQVRRHKHLLEKFASANQNLRLLQFDEFARYAVKMATGSGKTKVIALAVAWHFFNAVVEARDDYARASLILAPNVIVFERLRTDFANGRIFRVDPVIPPEFKIFWDFDCYMRGDTERAQSVGALYLTNIQQFYERAGSSDEDEPDIMTAMLGPRPPAQFSEVEPFDVRLARRGGQVLVLNDEAHHTHEEGSQWNAVIRRVHALPSRLGRPVAVAAQLDFSATPRFAKGALFSWTVCDYPLKQAIEDHIVKRPVKGITSGIREIASDVASTRYRAYLAAGVERWREYAEQLGPLNKKPLLFVMLNSTAEADDVGDYLQKKHPTDFGGEKLLVIHTDRSGEVSKKDLDVARKLARDVDQESSPVNAVVSVLMLREGWDVQSVTVIVGLRPYSSKANILPEQTIGRGLRLMFRGLAVDYTERVDVIGNKAFIEFVEQLERDEDLELDTFEVGKDKLSIVTIAPDPDKADKDIALPVLTPLLSRKHNLAEEIAGLDVLRFECPILPRKQDDKQAEKFHYEGFDLLTLQKLIERDYTLPEIQTAQEVISYYAKRIAQDVKLPSQFAALAPKVTQFLRERAFGERVNLDDPEMIKAISSNVAQYVTVKTFVAALQPLVVEELTPQLLNPGRRLSEGQPFPWSRPTLDHATKCVLNLVPCDNEFERKFARFLQDARDVARFSKLPESFGFAVEYTDAVGNLRYYYPDFVGVLSSGEHYLLETKGQETTEVAYKDRAARNWAENATRLTSVPWRYLKVPQSNFNELQPSEFADLLVFATQQHF
jgi:type III restriction enzyme